MTISSLPGPPGPDRNAVGGTPGPDRNAAGGTPGPDSDAAGGTPGPDRNAAGGTPGPDSDAAGGTPGPGDAVAEREYALALPDGRRLSYTFHGAPAGPLVVVLDGPGSRGLARAASPIAAALGVRLVTPDRPGFFSSSPAPGRGIADWPADHAALLDALEVERAGIVGQSGGTPYALAAAIAMPEQVTGLALIAPAGPLGDRENLADAGAQLRTAAKLSRRAPWLLRLGLRAASRKAAKDPEKAAAGAAKDMPPADAAVLREPGHYEIHLRATTEILSRPDAIASEIGLLARPWCIDLAQCRVPVSFWSGDRDVVHPTSHARRLAAALGGAPVHVVPGAATFGLMPVYGDALRFAAGRDLASA